MGNLREALSRLDPDMMFMDGYDDALLGFCEQFGRPIVALYSKEGVLRILMDSGLDYSEAEEFFYFNQHGAWVGEYTPVFATVISEKEE